MAFNPSQLQSFALAGSGAVAGATSVVLKSFQSIDGVALTMADIGDVGYGTLEPGNGAQEEQISFTGVTQNTNGTATLTGVSTVLFLTPYTETSGLAKTHPGASVFVVSNTSGFYNQFAILDNNDVVTGYWEAPTPLSAAGIATKGYVDNLVNGGTVSTNALIEVGTAGETLSAGNVVYLKASDGRWWKALATTAATVDVIQLGIAQGAGTAGNAITGGVLRRGIDTNQSGGVAGSIGYISNTGTIATSAGTVERAIGNFITATTFDFDPAFYYLPSSSQKDFLNGTTGMIISYGGSAAPTGWLSCDGSAVSRTTYADLFTVISTTYGVGDGSTTFNVPDGRGRTFIGSGTGSKVATFASRSSNVITVTGLTNAANNEFQTGQAVFYHTTGTDITGLTNDTTYYVIRITNTSFSLATSLANAQNGTVISLSGDGTGTRTFTLTLTARSAGDTGGEENHAMSSTELLAHTHSCPGPAGSGSGQAFTLVDDNPTVTGSTGGNAAMNNMQPFFTGLWIIKT